MGVQRVHVLMGSSPLARGPLGLSGSAQLDAGLIPARAGTTGTAQYPPRVVKGSSPLARGPPCVLVKFDEHMGLIPARAGTTLGLTGSLVIAGAHPRSRGDHQSAIMCET